MSDNDSPTRDSKSDYIYRLLKDESLRLDLWDVKLITKSGEEIPINLPTWISVNKDHFYLHLRRIRGEEVHKNLGSLLGWPEEGFSYVGFDDHPQISARTENNASVVLEAVSPNPEEMHETDSVIKIYCYRFWRLHITPEGLSTLNYEQKQEYFRQRRLARGDEETDQPEEKHEAEDYFFAILPNVDLMIFSDRTRNVLTHPFRGEIPSAKPNCFIGKAMGGRYCLEQVGDDIHVDFVCPVGSDTVEEASAKFDGILQTIGFIHGCHPWPCFYSHSRDCRISNEWIWPRSPIQRDVLRPLGHHKLLTHENMNALDLFPKSAAFFASHTDESKTIVNALWLMRESCHKGIAKEISMLTMCSIFEGMVKPYVKKNPCEKIPKKDKTQRLWIEPIANGYQLPFEWFTPAVESFVEVRNHLAHGFDFGPGKRQTFRILDTYSRLSGAIYMLILRKMGYTGTIQTSTFENSKWVNFSKLERYPFPGSPEPNELI